MPLYSKGLKYAVLSAQSPSSLCVGDANPTIRILCVINNANIMAETFPWTQWLWISAVLLVSQDIHGFRTTDSNIRTMVIIFECRELSKHPDLVHSINLEWESRKVVIYIDTYIHTHLYIYIYTYIYIYISHLKTSSELFSLFQSSLRWSRLALSRLYWLFLWRSVEFCSEMPCSVRFV